MAIRSPMRPRASAAAARTLQNAAVLGQEFDFDVLCAISDLSEDDLVEALDRIITAGLVFGIKLAVRRRRPAGEWGAFYRRTDPHSFPSGHAARMAMLAAAGFTLGHPWFGLALTVWAPLVSLARVAMGVHYVSDVIGGLLIGVVAGCAMGWAR